MATVGSASYSKGLLSASKSKCVEPPLAMARLTTAGAIHGPHGAADQPADGDSDGAALPVALAIADAAAEHGSDRRPYGSAFAGTFSSIFQAGGLAAGRADDHSLSL